jgi:hypothetical protein
MRMDFEVDKQLAEVKTKAEGLVQNIISTKKENDDIISKNLEEQKDAFKKRLEARRNQSFMKSGSILIS